MYRFVSSLRMMSLIVGILRSLCIVMLQTYQWAFVMVLRKRFCFLCRLFICDCAAIPHTGAAYIICVLMIMVYCLSLFLINRSLFLPSNGYNRPAVEGALAALHFMCSFQVSFLSSVTPR